MKTTSRERQQETKPSGFSTPQRTSQDRREGLGLTAPLAQSTGVRQRALGNSVLKSWSEISAGPPRVQRACACAGRCSACASKNESLQKVQAKLTIGPAHDVYEQEADRVADQVMRMPERSEVDNEGVLPALSIQRISSGDAGGFDPGAGFRPNQGGGQPLSPATRRFMEPRFGADFSDVRIHTGSQAETSAASIQARAYTYGRNITLGKGASENDPHLMAHELTHVIQQGGASDAVNRAPLSEKIQRDPPQTACPGGTKTITVDLVSLDGSTRDAPADLDFANKVFKPCCVQFQLGVGVSTSQANSSAWLGGDTDLQVGGCGSASQEELDTYNGSSAAHGTTGRFRAFYVDSISSGARADSYPPYCATGTAAPLQGMVSVTNSAASRSLAHEFGHILLNSASHTGIDNPADTGNLMIPTNSSTGEALDATQCATIFGNA